MKTITRREEALFEAAREITDTAARDAYLGRACGGDGLLCQHPQTRL